MRSAQHVCAEYGVVVEQIFVEVDEIQHHDSLKIAEHKARSVYEITQQPILVNDSSWSKPALGGFPGGYMKDVAAWLSTSDFMNLIQEKNDKRIILTDTNSYFDGTTYKEFTATRYGKFVERPRGISGPSFARVVVMDGDDKTISEIFDEPERKGGTSHYDQWCMFLDWFTRGER